MKDSPRETTNSHVPPLARCAADSPETTAPLRAGWPRLLAWLPVPLLLVAIIAARAAGLRETYENDALRLVLSFVFYTLVSLGTLFLIGRSFPTSGSPGLLLLECGVILWSLAGTVGDVFDQGDANINVTIFNTGILLAGLCHLAGAALLLWPQRSLSAKPLWLGAGCALALGSLGLVTWAALAHWLPVFFIPGPGGTTVRYCVLISATATFVFSAVLLHTGQRGARPPFTAWYSLALLLLAVGLFGIMIQSSLWSVVNWLSRTAQWLGGFYLLLAAIAALRESNQPLLPMGEKSRPALYREAMAVVTVLAAAAIRLAFLSALGTHAPFIVFYPAVIFAALYGGRRAGLLATALSAILADYFWIEPTGQFALANPADWLGVVIFLLSGALIAWSTEALLRARARATAAETQALLAAQREAAAEALRESEAKYRDLFENMTEEVHFWKLVRDPNGQIKTWRLVDANPPTLKTWGKTLGEIQGKTTDEIFGPGATGHYLPVVQKIMTDGVPFVFEDYFPHLDKHFRFTSVPLGDYFITTGADITSIKKAELALRESECRLRTLGDQIPGGAIYQHVQRPDGRVDYAYMSAGVERLFGLSPQRVLADPDAFRRLVVEEDRGRLAAVEEQSARQLTPFDCEFRQRTVTGEVKWVQCRSTPRRLEDGSVLWDGIVVDITERKQVEEALRQSEQRVRSKLESILSPEGDIGHLDLADIIDAPAIQSLMDHFYKLARIPMAIIDLQGKVLVGAGWQDVCTKFHRVHPETCKHCIESDTQLSAGVAPGEFKLYKCKNNMWDIATPIMVGGRQVGNLFTGQFFFDDEPLDDEPFRSQARRYGFDEQPYLAALEAVPRLSRESVDAGMGFFIRLAQMLSLLSYSNIKLARSLTERDALIAERRQAEESLRESERRIRASLAEKEVLLKEIHHRVKNNMQVISSLVALQAERLPDAAMRSVLQDVTHRVRSMALVHEKLYQSADMAQVEFAEYSQSLLNYLWRAYETTASGVGLALDLEPVPLSVNAAVPCGLILNELVSNALKHAFCGRAGGEVTVSLRGGREGRVCLRVRDNGAGLPAGLDWRQADSLGLRLVQLLAGQLDATVDVCSNQGTEFAVAFGGPKNMEDGKS